MKLCKNPPKPFKAMVCDLCHKEVTEAYAMDEQKGRGHIRTYRCRGCYEQKDKTDN